jgi:predicted SAM-dependent methyltransferase
MRVLIEKHWNIPPRSLVVDIGARDINGTYRPIIEPKWNYLGVDIMSGPNVDVVMLSEFAIPLADQSANAVLCGHTLEHCRKPWLLADEMMRILKPGGWLMVVAPAFYGHVHPHPWDCWRILPDGMKVLFPDEIVDCREIFLTKHDTWFVGVKRESASVE